MTVCHRLGLLAASISTAFLLSACQPTTSDTQSDATQDADITETQTAETVETIDPHAGHDMTGGETLADETPVTDMLKDYTNSMTQMHDEMMIGMAYNDPDTAFAKGMLGHHHGAVDMAKIQLKYGTDATMRQLAEDVIEAQQGEIAIMNKWLASHPDATKPKPNTLAMQQAYAAGMDKMHGDMLLGVADPKPDMAFARGMLPHHIGAVEMAKVQLKYGTDKEMRVLAQDIIDAQQAEIDLMKNWIATHSTDTDDTLVDETVNQPSPIEQPAA